MYTYKGLNLSLRNKVFWGFIFICFLSMAGTTLISYYILRNNSIQLSQTDQQNKADAMMAALDYSISHSEVDTRDLPKVLENAIYEIADINKHDLIIYDLQGNYLLSNKEKDLVPQKKVDQKIIHRLLQNQYRVDEQSYDEALEANLFSSYILLKNNVLKPVAIVYLPYYHSDSVYLSVLERYTKYIIFLNFIVILISIAVSWVISNNVSQTIRKFSDMIAKITLFGENMNPIRYYPNDELSSLVNSYNKMLLQIQYQKDRLSHTAKEGAWREMAKQVAHEVKNPLTPMKLSIQNFERKFNPEDPKIYDRVKNLCTTLVSQIDLITAVADAFSQFETLPEKNNEVFNLKDEVMNIVQIFHEDDIKISSSRSDILINMDKIYLNRIIVNLITNAKQAKSDDRALRIHIKIEQINRKVKISVQDNGIGIAEDMYERIFEPNFTSKSSGKGLGLSMVKKMVTDYQGEISLRSEIGVGTSFIITLPASV